MSSVVVDALFEGAFLGRVVIDALIIREIGSLIFRARQHYTTGKESTGDFLFYLYQFRPDNGEPLPTRLETQNRAHFTTFGHAPLPIQVIICRGEG